MAEQPHPSVDKRHCHTQVIWHVNCWSLLLEWWVAGSPLQMCTCNGWITKSVTESVGGGAVIPGALYVHNTHIWLYIFNIAKLMFCKSTNNCNGLCYSSFPRKFHKWNWLKTGISSLTVLESGRGVGMAGSFRRLWIWIGFEFSLLAWHGASPCFFFF